MTEDDFSEFIADHADAIQASSDISANLLTEQPEESTDLRTLFALSNSVRAVLVPVRAPSFKASLRQRIESRQQEKPRFRALASRQKVVWIVVATAGSLLSITGVVLLVLRKLKTSGKAARQAATAPI
ncbi:MAG: hypothetical protein WA996_01165 [Candidatus Promineifilaceae bacterium]